MGRLKHVDTNARGGRSHDDGRVPVVLPHLSITITDTDESAEGGQLAVTLNGEPYEIPAEAGEGRSALGPLVEQVATDLGCPVRIEVSEVDGSVFTEIVEPPRLPAPDAPAPAPLATQDIGESVVVAGGRLEVGGSGFAPDEEVAVAVVVAHQTAGSDGCARLRLPAALLASRPGTVVLLGRSSGVVAVSGSRA